MNINMVRKYLALRRLRGAVYHATEECFCSLFSNRTRYTSQCRTRSTSQTAPATRRNTTALVLFMLWQYRTPVQAGDAFCGCAALTIPVLGP